MANGSDGEPDGCIFQWKIENISHCWWLKKGEPIISPTFIADEVHGSKFSLRLWFMGEEEEDEVSLYLYREEDCSGPDVIAVNYQLTLLKKDGSSIEEEICSQSIVKGESSGYTHFEELEKFFITERDTYLPEDILTVQCTIFEKKEKPIKSKNLFARTIFKTNRASLFWRIDEYSTLKCESRNKLKDGSIDFDLVLKEIQGFENKKEIAIIMNSFDDRMQYFSIKTYIVDSEGKKVNCGMNEYFADDLKTKVLSFSLDFPRNFMEDRRLYLPNDVLSLICDSVVYTETVLCEYFSNGMISTELAKEKSQSTTVLTDDLKSMYNDGILSDIELRTSTQTFQAHRNILSARSPVFRSMFSCNMKEKNSGHVDITDFEDDTIHRMLLYMYTDSLEDLQVESASNLYSAADKYQILSMKSKCSSFLKDNLCQTNACDALILADLHQDGDLIDAVQCYILDHEEVFSSEEWMQLMESNIKLAADVMFRKINPGKIRPCNARKSK